MIVFAGYVIVLLALFYWNGFFGLFNDPLLSRKKLCLLFLGKIIAVPVFFSIYQVMYGGIEKFDTGKFYHDVLVISDFAKKDPLFYLRLLFGLQDDCPGSYDYVNCLKNTVNWDNGTIKDYLFNDNRIVIRVHTAFDFFTFGSYHAHALFNCFLSFTGIFFLYKTFKHLFGGKEIHFIFVLCFFPALWFYTGALLKEGICLFLMGTTLYHVRACLERRLSISRMVFLLFLLFVSCLLKPYLILTFLLVFGTYFILEHYFPEKKRLPVFCFTIICALLLANTGSLILKDRSLIAAAFQHQTRFETVSHGGVFLARSDQYFQLSPDTSQIVRSSTGAYRIRKNVQYMYWLDGNPSDTLYCKANQDTITEYKLIYYIPPSGSNIALNKKNFLSVIGSVLYYTFLYPFFFNAGNPLQFLASFENLALLIAMLITVIGIFKSGKAPFFPMVCLFFAIGISLLVGVSAPNSGAIFRYRAPADVFILLAALYYIPLVKGWSDPENRHQSIRT